MKLSRSTPQSLPKHRPHCLAAPPAGRMRPLETALALLLLAGLAGNAVAETRKPAATHGEVAERKGDLKQLRGQIETLRKGVAAAEGKRSNAADQLRDIEKEISVTQRDLHTLGNQRDQLQAKLSELAKQSHELQGHLSTQQQQLERIVYRQYLQGKPDSLRLLLNGNDSNQMARDLHYLAIIGHARSQLLEETENTLQRKQALANDTQQRAAELAAVEARQKQEHGKLLAQREQRQQMLDKISATITQQRREIGNLQRDEKQLTQVIEQLARTIAAQEAQAARAAKAEKAEKAAQAARAAQQAKATPPRGRGATNDRQSAPSAAAAAPTPYNDAVPQAAADGDFARLQGNLRLPVRGQVSNRFGSPRQEGSTWKGLFIRAAAGGEVRAVAAGRVVFADWMRGFGNIVIVDHGASYLSVYGNNEALLKQTGDSVRGGDVIASVGNSGGNPESGLYFELRHRGQPLDPQKWINLK